MNPLLCWQYIGGLSHHKHVKSANPMEVSIAQAPKKYFLAESSGINSETWDS
jgi:hypothetical protein